MANDLKYYDKGYDLAWDMDNEGKPLDERIAAILDFIEGMKDYLDSFKIGVKPCF